MQVGNVWRCGLAALVAIALVGCGGGGAGSGGVGTDGSKSAAQTYRICPGPDAQKQALFAFFDAREGDLIEFCEGQFEFRTSLIMTGKRGVTIRGAGRDKTILSFASSPAQDGLSLNQVNGITVEDLAIVDTPGNSLRVFRTQDITIRRVKVGWSNADPEHPNFDPSMESWNANGAYGFYPVLCERMLIEDSIAYGSADSGFYVGQCTDITVRDSLAYHNVVGFEFENTYRAEFVNNEVRQNVGGIMIFDLPGRAYFGEFNRIYNNRIFDNNIPTFAPRGAIVALVPPGTGMLVVGADQAQIFNNEVYDNKTVGLGIINYGLADASEASTTLDWYPEGLHIYNNTFRDNAYQPAEPRFEENSCNGAPELGIPTGLPGPRDSPDCVVDNGTLLPLILQVKNQGRSAQIVWDGGVDRPNNCTTIPVDADGIPLTEPNPSETGRREPRIDFRGRPNFYEHDPLPVCKWNVWKFDAQGQLKKPENGLCIENNVFENTGLMGPRVDDYTNMNFSSPDPTDPANLQPADRSKPQDCPPTPTALADAFTPAPPRYQASAEREPRPTEAEVARLCAAGRAGQVNQAALDQVNCPKLSDYGLFSNPTDPTTAPRGNGVPFELNTVLFSDYASKYRFMFLPQGDDGLPIPIGYEDHEDCNTLVIYNCYTATLRFPVGTVLSKTFSFQDGDAEEIVETRLLIKRRKADGSVFWVGLPYRWKDTPNGREAHLMIEGDTVSVSWNYTDPDPDVQGANGEPMRYTGSTDSYAVPNAGACLLCHGGDDLEPGAPPIGPKVRNLNRDNVYPGVGRMNQLAYLQMQGLLSLPDAPENLERLPRWNVPGDSGAQPDSPADINARARAYLEVNCLHCHTIAGSAQNSGLFLDSFESPIPQNHGICKVPIAAGKAADFGNYDIEPGFAQRSILPARVATTQPGAMMPPLARSVPHGPAVELLAEWVNNVVGDFAAESARTCGQ